LIISAAFALGLHNANSSIATERLGPAPSEVAKDADEVFISAASETTIPWPLYADGTQATVSECVGIASSSNRSLWLAFSTSAGYRILNNMAEFTGQYTYMLVCSREVPTTVGVEGSTWSNVKSTYR